MTEDVCFIIDTGVPIQKHTSSDSEPIYQNSE